VQAHQPSLPEMTRTAITLLSSGHRHGKGFFLLVEGALIDKRSHADDAAQTLEESTAFDDAVVRAPGASSASERFVIAVPAQWRGRAVSAAVGVPVLADE
jgi:alkaline phosphatase